MQLTKCDHMLSFNKIKQFGYLLAPYYYSLLAKF